MKIQKMIALIDKVQRLELTKELHHELDEMKYIFFEMDSEIRLLSCNINKMRGKYIKEK